MGYSRPFIITSSPLAFSIYLCYLLFRFGAAFFLSVGTVRSVWLPNVGTRVLLNICNGRD